ncbi:hypothetical protein CK203_066700 [Vitis vinifera]|uniref:Uncharacterized protein n=1 Tax=Vitis vinifera TaxID=29760 RepID=A0A438EVD2_VITVI|nr:hypothetical protein CK203_066700 [Vitis vinifera]
MPHLTPLSISYEKLLPVIQGLSDFRWPRPIATDPSTRDRSKRCAFHKDHGHTTETCRSFQFGRELIKAGHLKQYLRSDNGGRDASQHHNPGPRAPAAPKAVINYITEVHLTRSTTLGERGKNCCGCINTRTHQSIRPGLTGEGPRPIDGTIIFPSDPTRTLQPHRDALILSLEIGDFDVRRILVDPGSSADCASISRWPHGTQSQALKTLDESIRIQRIINYILGRYHTAGPSWPSHSQRTVFVVQELSPFNVILGRTWLHYMKAIPSTYHQMVSFLTNDGQIDLYGSQLAARQCYQIARAGANQEDASPPEPSIAHDQ